MIWMCLHLWWPSHERSQRWNWTCVCGWTWWMRRWGVGTTIIHAFLCSSPGKVSSSTWLSSCDQCTNWEICQQQDQHQVYSLKYSAIMMIKPWAAAAFLVGSYYHLQVLLFIFSHQFRSLFLIQRNDPISTLVLSLTQVLFSVSQPCSYH